MSRKKKTVSSRKEEVLGILLLTLGILMFISLATYDSQEHPDNITFGKVNNRLGFAGAYISHFLIQFVIGYPSFVFPIIIFITGWNFLRGNPFSTFFRWVAYPLVFAIYTSVILALPEVTSSGSSQFGFSLSGLVGGVIAQFLFNYLGIAGSIILLLGLIMVTVIGATNLSFSGILTNIGHGTSSAFYTITDMISDWGHQKKTKKDKPAINLGRDFDWRDEEQPKERIEPPLVENFDAVPESGQIEFDVDSEDSVEEKRMPLPKDIIASGNYVFPHTGLLATPESQSHEMSEAELNANAQILEDRLLEFGIEGKVVQISPGPVITRYEVEPAPGIKISRIVGLADDLALAMRAKRIRIVAPIPGKGAVGVEIPNREQSIVYLKNTINSTAFQNSPSPLALALGETISGEPFVANLDQMPHVLIAGSTGSGKSICLNSIIASILFKAHPIQVQFVMIDPKRLELSIYNNLRHHHLTYRKDLNEEVVTNASNAISVLKSMEVVMEQRYEVLARAGVRNISDYNKKLQSGQLKEIESEAPFEHLEYLVLIIDELADLMLTGAREVEEPIARLTQMSRAVGIHLIVATQRPSVDVITGVIKANFPARIAFQVASKTDSRTILDLNGAEKLLGRGDMLFIPPGSPEPVRIHGAFISTDEIEDIIAHIRKQPRYPKHTLPVEKAEAVSGGFEGDGFGGSRDALFNEALKLVVRHQQGSISLLQRRLKVGYARAARLIDELEAAGVVGPFDGSKAREVLWDEQELEQADLS